ncbi:hypothetical protein BB558_000427, partial [Smittium angustum]
TGLPYEIGNWVLVEVKNKKKLEAKLMGPYKVIRVGPLHTYKLEDSKGKEVTELVHHDRMDSFMSFLVNAKQESFKPKEEPNRNSEINVVNLETEKMVQHNTGNNTSREPESNGFQRNKRAKLDKMSIGNLLNDS